MTLPVLRIAEAQQLYDAVTDDLFKPAFLTFLNEQHKAIVGDLVSAVRQSDRDTMKEAQMAGQLEVYETIYKSLTQFAEKNLKEAQ